MEGASVRTYILAVILLGLVAFAGCGQGKSTDGLIADLSSPNEGDRINAVRLLPQRRGDATKVVPALVESLKDGHADIRWSAAIGLGYFGAQAKSAVPALEKAKGDTDARVREAARVAISRIQG
jgi:HEAT repeat protein